MGMVRHGVAMEYFKQILCCGTKSMGDNHEILMDNGNPIIGQFQGAHKLSPKKKQVTFLKKGEALKVLDGDNNNRSLDQWIPTIPEDETSGHHGSIWAPETLIGPEATMEAKGHKDFYKIIDYIKKNLMEWDDEQCLLYSNHLQSMGPLITQDEEVVHLHYGLWLIDLKHIDNTLADFYSKKPQEVPKFNSKNSFFHQELTVKIQMDLIVSTMEKLLDIAQNNLDNDNIITILMDMLEKYKLLNHLILHQRSQEYGLEGDNCRLWTKIYDYMVVLNQRFSCYDDLSKARIYDTIRFGYDGFQLSAKKILYKLGVAKANGPSTL
jgi:hypothetical protein